MRFYIKTFLLILLLDFISVFAQESSNLVYVDNNGNLKWTNTNENAYFFGVNYSVPFAFSYRAFEDKGISHKEVIDLDVQQFKRLGMNAYRIHVWDREVSDKDGNLLNNEHIELLDYLIAKLIENDIYIILTPIAWWGTGWPAPDVETPGFSTFYSKIESTTKPEVLKAHTNYLKQFLNHINSYTGKTYTKEEKIIAYEIFNEPNLPKDVEAIKHYVNTTVKVFRDEGITKPIFFNISENPAKEQWEGVASSNIDGVSFQWYPTGLVKYSELKGNFLPHVLNYSIPNHTDKIKDKAKIVYEFDAADIGNSIMYPVMAHSFREAGMQWATMFCYDPTPLAQFNSEYSTHYLNLLYTPQKALGFLIASNVFKQNKIDKKSFNNSILLFDDVITDYENDLSLLNDGKNFYYTNSNNIRPKEINLLSHIAGFGNSNLVKYAGKGSYFLDKIKDGLWELEVYPDAAWINDPFGKNGLTDPVANLIWKKHPIKINLPDILQRIFIFKIDHSRIFKANNFTIDVGPGRYFISNDKNIQDTESKNSQTDFSLVKKYGSFISDYSTTEIKNLTPENYQENQVAKINTEVYSSENDFDVYIYFKKAGWRDYQKELMTAKDDFYFEYSLPTQLNKNGFLEYFISVEKGKDILTFPGKINSSPNNWDFNSQENYQLKILPVSDKITIYNPLKDKNNIIFSNIWRDVDYNIDYTFDENEKAELSVFINKVKESFPELAFQISVGEYLDEIQIDDNSKLMIELKNNNDKIKKVLIRFLFNDGTASQKEIKLTNNYQLLEFAIPEPENIQYALLPRPYPTFLPYLFTTSQLENHNEKLKLESIQIAIPLPETGTELNDGIKIKQIIIKQK
ncbi:MAG: cellulase family glycosylhydrolase [Ignavibacteriales bacterium]|nr:cellulase family glycosylhydrolase [Ignavibacteriales bacterium]